MRNPDSTKNRSTPRNPPVSAWWLVTWAEWKAMTPMTASPRSPSSAGMWRSRPGASMTEETVAAAGGRPGVRSVPGTAVSGDPAVLGAGDHGPDPHEVPARDHDADGHAEHADEDREHPQQPVPAAQAPGPRRPPGAVEQGPDRDGQRDGRDRDDERRPRQLTEVHGVRLGEARCPKVRAWPTRSKVPTAATSTLATSRCPCTWRASPPRGDPPSSSPTGSRSSPTRGATSSPPSPTPASW